MAARDAQGAEENGANQQVKYLLYRSRQQYRGGVEHSRLRIKRVPLPPSARDIRVEGPGEFQRRSGQRIYGVKVTYRHQVAGALARRGETRYELPEREMTHSKVIALARPARDVKLLDQPPVPRKGQRSHAR
ncbi:MAG TPA: hypothetical protein VIO14_00410 [Dehalococcoidia bacterium]